METQNLPLNPQAVRWFEKRGIEGETVIRFGIYTGTPSRDDKGETTVIPDVKGTVIVWPYLQGGRVVNEKYRAKNSAGARVFWQKKGGRKTFWNVDVLDDPAIQGQNATASVVITEGEPDGMVAVECGHPWSMSAPDGAPAARDNTGKPIPMRPDHEVDPADDAKYEYIYNNWDKLAKVRHFILATDGDEQGQRLRDEIARRLGRARCSFITYPSDIVVDDKEIDGGKRACKDLNEVRLHFGRERVLDIIQRAKPYPVSGLYKLSDFPEQAERVLYDVGIRQFEGFFSLYRGAFIISSGLPGSGKSALWDQIAFNMAENHGWRVAIGTFEEGVRPDLLRKLRAFHIRKPRQNWLAEDVRRADEFIEEHFIFVTRDPLGSRDSEATVDWVVGRMTDAVLRHGVNMAVIDPWNQIDHRKMPGEARDEYMNRSINDVVDFSHRMDVCTVVIAHPTKDGAQNSTKDRPIGLYDISDGAVWPNKAEMGFIIHRPNPVDVVSRVYLKKAKFKDIGKPGVRTAHYIEDEERFDCEWFEGADELKSVA